MNFIILADKFQKGMKSKGCVGLIKVNSKNNLLQHQYKTIKACFPKAKIVYIYGFEQKRVLNFLNDSNMDIIPIFNEKYDEFNYSYSLSLANKYIGDNCFILFGDTLFRKEIFNDFNGKQGSLVYVNKKEKSKLGCIVDDKQTILNICFDLENYLMDIYYIHKKDTAMLKNIINIEKHNNYFLFEIINKMIDNGTKFKSINKNKKQISLKLSNKIKI